MRIRRWALWSTSPRLIGFTLGVELMAVGVAGLALRSEAFSLQTAQRMALCLGLSIGFEELTRRIERLRFRLTSGALVDLSSVWIFAATVVLPPGYATVLIVVMRTHLWLRQQRGSGMRLYRQVFTAAAFVLASQAAGGVRSAVDGRLDALPPGLSVALIIGIALCVYLAVNVTLVLTAIWLATRPASLRSMMPTWDEVSLEIATLSLGGLIALAVLHQPWSALLVLPPMLVLQRSALVRQLEEAATIDAKTGLLNPLAWQRVGQREIARAEREHTPVAVLIADLDHFKSVNDTFGHLIGDVVLARAGQCLVDELRGYDSVGRFGGEEFVAVLPDVDIDVALLIAERIRARVAALSIDATSGIKPSVLAEGGYHLSTSIGVACYPAHGTDLVTLLSGADTALYRAKRAGRDRVVVADEIDGVATSSYAG
ncbi:MAG: diguanylate cyclase [Actinomycetota bacterium]